jgi:hypothetical protein
MTGMNGTMKNRQYASPPPLVFFLFAVPPPPAFLTPPCLRWPCTDIIPPRGDPFTRNIRERFRSGYGAANGLPVGRVRTAIFCYSPGGRAREMKLRGHALMEPFFLWLPIAGNFCACFLTLCPSPKLVALSIPNHRHRLENRFPFPAIFLHPCNTYSTNIGITSRVRFPFLLLL